MRVCDLFTFHTLRIYTVFWFILVLVPFTHTLQFRYSYTPRAILSIPSLLIDIVDGQTFYFVCFIS